MPQMTSLLCGISNQESSIHACEGEAVPRPSAQVGINVWCPKNHREDVQNKWSLEITTWAHSLEELCHWKKKREGCCHFTWSTSSYVHQAENNQFLNCFSSLLAIWLRKGYLYMLTTYDVKLFQFLGIQQGTKGSLCTHSKFSIWAAEVSTKSRHSESAGKREGIQSSKWVYVHVGALCTYVCTPVYLST